MTTVSGFNVALIIPTGIGASIGGFGGDAMSLLPLFSSVCDTVITHPNVANAACFQKLPENTLYVEGFALDQFFKGAWTLHPVRQNSIGIIWDAGIPESMEILHRNTLAAVQTVYGLNIAGLQKTAAPVSLSLQLDPSGRSAGVINNPQVLLEAGQKLFSQGAQALAVCCLMPDNLTEGTQDLAYRSGQGVDPIGGLEAMISHFLTAHLQIPVAHAPVFQLEDALPVTDKLLDPRSASEFIVSTFLPCVLTGLSKAPQLKPAQHPRTSDELHIDEVSAVIAPGNALGSIPVLSALERNIPVLAIQNNPTVMACDTLSLGEPRQIVPCQNYLEALGHLVALKNGITVPPHISESTLDISKQTDYAKA